MGGQGGVVDVGTAVTITASVTDDAVVWTVIIFDFPLL